MDNNIRPTQQSDEHEGLCKVSWNGILYPAAVADHLIDFLHVPAMPYAEAKRLADARSALHSLEFQSQLWLRGLLTEMRSRLEASGGGGKYTIDELILLAVELRKVASIEDATQRVLVKLTGSRE